MKFFSSERGSCFGCSVNNSSKTAEIISVDASVTRRRKNQRKSTKNWTPVLNVIAEDGVRNRSPESTAVARSVKKPLNKSKSAGRNRSVSCDNDYRKSSYQVALPVFSPTPFML